MAGSKWIGKLCSTVISAVMSLSMLTALPNVAEGTDSVLQGDCDGNGRVNEADVYLLQCFLVGMEPMVYVTSGADMDGNGSVNAVDLALLKNKVLSHQSNVTMLVYQCGSDLESEATEATIDLYEMAEADFEHLTLVVETGGSTAWYNGISHTDANYRITLDDDDVNCKKISNQPKNMGDSSTLSDFIIEETALHPADHYALVLWNHGGGPIYGVCNDTLSNDMLTINEIRTALEKSQVHFDWIGFDACMMGNFETAYAIKDYADYMVASEETESGYGWYYTDFISTWAQNPDIETEVLVQCIVDDMVSINAEHDQIATLAAYDLSKADAMMQALTQYLGDAYAMLQNNGVSALKYYRGRAVEFGQGNYDVVDIGSLAENLALAHSSAVRAALSDMVIYARQTQKAGATGMAMWFANNYPSDYIYIDYIYPYAGISSEYIKYIKEIAKAIGNSKRVMSEQSMRSDQIILDAQAIFRQMMQSG